MDMRMEIDLHCALKYRSCCMFVRCLAIVSPPLLTFIEHGPVNETERFVGYSQRVPLGCKHHIRKPEASGRSACQEQQRRNADR